MNHQVGGTFFDRPTIVTPSMIKGIVNIDNSGAYPVTSYKPFKNIAEADIYY
jgi:hypothetical protein